MAGDAESTTGESNEPVTALVNENVERVNETIDVGSHPVASMTTQGLDELQRSDEDPEDGTPAAAAAQEAIAPPPAINPRSMVATVHYVEWRRALSNEPVLNGNHTPSVWRNVRNVLEEQDVYPGRPKIGNKP